MVRAFSKVSNIFKASRPILGVVRLTLGTKVGVPRRLGVMACSKASVSELICPRTADVERGVGVLTRLDTGSMISLVRGQEPMPGGRVVPMRLCRKRAACPMSATV